MYNINTGIWEVGGNVLSGLGTLHMGGRQLGCFRRRCGDPREGQTVCPPERFECPADDKFVWVKRTVKEIDVEEGIELSQLLASKLLFLCKVLDSKGGIPSSRS